MRVYIHGNCQAPAIASLMKQQFPDWDIASYEVFSQKIIDDVDRFHHYVETADIVVSQPVQVGYRGRDDLSLSWVRETARRDAAFVVFPSMFFDGQLVGCRSAKIAAYGMPYHDALLLHFVAAGVALPDMIKILLADDLYPDSFIENEISLSVLEMRRREQVDLIDVPISPFLANYAASMQLFHVINHPCRPALAYTANMILSHLGYPAGISAIGKELLRFPHIPCPPCVDRFMQRRGGGLPEWCLEHPALYHLPTEKLMRWEYFVRCYEYLEQLPRADLMACLDEPQIRAFLQRVADKIPTLPGISVWGRPASSG